MKKDIDFEEAEGVGLKEMFTAHPIRFIICVPFWLLEIKVFLTFCFTPITVEAVIILIIKLAALTFVTWLGYGPMNINNLRRQKELKVVAEYIRGDGEKKDSGTPENQNKESVGKSMEQQKQKEIWLPEGNKRRTNTTLSFCSKCGKQLDSNWQSCPYCGSEIQM